MSQIQHYLRFQVSYEWYGIEVGSVIEVLHFLELSEMPVSRPDLLGMIRLRGFVVPVIDLRLGFGLTASYSLNTPIIVANTPSGPIGLVADSANDLENIDNSQITTQNGDVSPYIMGVARLSDYLLLLLDVSRLRSEIPTL